MATILNIIFNAYIFILLIRLLLQKFGANWSNPLSQLIVKITEPVIKPLRKFLPGLMGFDLAAVVAAFVIQVIATFVVISMKLPVAPGFVGSVVIAFGFFGYKIVDIYVWSIIISAIMTWVPALQHNPVGGLINVIAEPALTLARRFVPRINGIDLSPIPLLLLLWILRAFVFKAFIVAGIHMAYAGVKLT